MTICTQDRSPWFGEIRSGIVGLNDAGCIVAYELQQTPIIRTSVTLDRWVVMPDHLHAIFHLCQYADGSMNTVETSRRDVSTDVAQLIPLCRLQSGSLGAVVNHIKSACTKQIRGMGFTNFAWQAGYHDRIIRSQSSLEAMRGYIAANPREYISTK